MNKSRITPLARFLYQLYINFSEVDDQTNRVSAADSLRVRPKILASQVLVFRGDPIVQKYDDPVIHTIREAQAFLGR